MSKISIKNQEDRDDVMMWVSDLYKDVYGIRPRGYNFQAFSNAELAEFVNDLSDELEKDTAREEAAEEKAIRDVMSLGADKKTALRWLDQADAHFLYGDDEFYTDSVEKFGWATRHFDKVYA